MQQKKLLLLAGLIIVASLIVVNRHTFNKSTTDAKPFNQVDPLQKQLPKGSFIREIDNIPGNPDKTILLYIENPSFDPNPPANTSDGIYMTCPEFTEGQSITGTYHLALTQNNNLIQDIVLPTSSGVHLNETYLRLSYRNTALNDYQYFQGPKYTQAQKYSIHIVNLINFGKFTPNPNNVDFNITGETAYCGGILSLHGSYNASQNSLVLYKVKRPDSEDYWGLNMDINQNGNATVLNECGDHGNGTRTTDYYQFEATEAAYVLYSSNRSSCGTEIQSQSYSL